MRPIQASPQINKIPNQNIRQSPIPMPMNNMPQSNIYNSPNVGQSGVQQIERIEQPLQVVDLDEIEGPWIKKVAELEEVLRRLKDSGKPPPPAPT